MHKEVCLEFMFKFVISPVRTIVNCFNTAYLFFGVSINIEISFESDSSNLINDGTDYPDINLML